MLSELSDLKTTKTVEPDDVVESEVVLHNFFKTVELSVDPSYNDTESYAQTGQYSSDISVAVTDITYSITFMVVTTRHTELSFVGSQDATSCNG